MTQAEAAGFGGRLLVLDMIEDLPRVMASLDVGVVASLGSEGSSRVTLEMMASGVPIVATRVGGIPEVLENEDCGDLVEPGQADQMAERALKLLSQEQAARTMAERALERARTHHSPDVWAVKIEEIYLQALANRGRTPEGSSET